MRTWSRPGISAGCVGRHPSRSCVCALETRQSAPTKYPSQPKWSAASSGGLGDDRHIQVAADDVSDVSKRHALFGDPVIPGSRRTLLKRQPEEMRSIESVHRGPAVEPVADKRRDTLLASQSDHVGDEALLHSVVDRWRQAHHRRAHAL
jgi:hypothetical protein